jgi:hypothetical protein
MSNIIKEDNVTVCATRSDGRGDPFVHLNTECLTNIISFLWHPNVPWLSWWKKLFDGVDEHDRIGQTPDAMAKGVETCGMRLIDAMIFHMYFSRVSDEWYNGMNRIFRHLGATIFVQLDLDELPPYAMEFSMNWLRHFKHPLRGVQCESQEAQKSVSFVLGFCDGTSVKVANIALFLPDARTHTPKPKEGRGLRESGFYDADDDCAMWSECQLQRSGSIQRHLQDTLAERCPNMDTLGLTLRSTGSCDLADALRPSLFSHEKIKNLYLALELGERHDRVSGSLVGVIIENLPSLEALALRSSHGSLVPTTAEGRDEEAFHIASLSLKYLFVQHFCTQRVCLSLNCPKLKYFRFKGDVDEGNNVLLVQQRVVRPVNVSSDCVVHIDPVRGQQVLLCRFATFMDVNVVHAPPEVQIPNEVPQQQE